MISGRLNAWLRYGLLGTNALASRGLNTLGRQARILEINLDGLHSLTIAPVVDIPCPHIDLARIDDPIPAILGDPILNQTDGYFAQNPASSRSLVSARTQALIYTIARNLCPDHVIEIGVYKASTTEAVARALHANGKGLVHTVDPFRAEYIAAVFKQWPSELVKHLVVHPTNSVDFFAAIEKEKIRPSIVFVDGNHKYEFAYFDICSAARHLSPHGFIFIDNIAQPGPFLAARDFLNNNAGWIECGGSTDARNTSKAYDSQRSSIPHTDLTVLRAPQHQHISLRPWSPGRVRRTRGRVSGIRLKLFRPSGSGTLSAQFVLRGFGRQPVELTDGKRLTVSTPCSTITAALNHPLKARGDFTHFTVEPWLTWESASPLLLSDAPEVY